MKNIKYLGFAKESSSAPILGITPQEESVDEIKIEVSKVKNVELRCCRDWKISSWDLRRGRRWSRNWAAGTARKTTEVCCTLLYAVPTTQKDTFTQPSTKFEITS